jgi:hypothetical protein
MIINTHTRWLISFLLVSSTAKKLDNHFVTVSLFISFRPPNQRQHQLDTMSYTSAHLKLAG